MFTYKKTINFFVRINDYIYTLQLQFCVSCVLATYLFVYFLNALVK